MIEKIMDGFRSLAFPFSVFYWLVVIPYCVWCIITKQIDLSGDSTGRGSFF